jgi:hypothetical protein
LYKWPEDVEFLKENKSFNGVVVQGSKKKREGGAVAP